MMEKLPSEIAFEIFYRLPPESIVLCKLVCKSWCSLLPLGDDGNHFANMYLHRLRCNLEYYSTLNFIALLKFRLEEEEGSAVGEFGIAEYNEVEELNCCKVKKLNFSQIKISNFGIIRLLGSCNGLVCMTRTNNHGSISFDRICICNPLLHEYVTLPLSDLQFKYYNSRDCDIVFGFGHNPITDEYKVVRVQNRRSEYSVFLTGDVEVYTLGKSNGMWRNKGTIKYSLCDGSPVHMNGSIHWLASSTGELKNIVSFDLEDEKFRVIPLPSYPHINIISEKLRKLRGCLCFIHVSHEMDESIHTRIIIMDIWVLKDYMNKESWVKEFSIKWKGELYYSPPVAIKKNKDGDGDEILLWSNCSRRKSPNRRILVSYDPKTQNFEEVVGGRQFVSLSIYDPEPILYVNSLVSLKALGEDAKYAENHPKTKA